MGYLFIIPPTGGKSKEFRRTSGVFPGKTDTFLGVPTVWRKFFQKIIHF